MQLHQSCSSAVWPAWQKVLFRFCFIYFGLYIMPLPWFDEVPVLSHLTKWYSAALHMAVTAFNKYLFTIKPVLVPKGGSGDTSFGWAEICFYATIALAGCLVWTILAKRRRNYAALNYYLCTGIRYFIAFIAFLYGIQKVFALQMNFPNEHLLATRLGDLLPMRFSWVFIGYSTPYQVFSGIMEVIVGLLLLYRRTASFGTIMSLVVFINVMMLNLCYDIPVKIFSIHMVLLSMFLLLQDSRRIIAFFIMNKDVASCNMYAVTFTTRGKRIARIILKAAFMFFAIGFTCYTCFGYLSNSNSNKPISGIKNGLYTIVYTLPPAQQNKIWKDAVLNNSGWGSISVEDTIFKKRYGRDYFDFDIDSTNNRISFKKNYDDSLALYSLQFTMLGTDTVSLSGCIGMDSVRMYLIKSSHKYQLAEKQFHWLSEGNR